MHPRSAVRFLVTAASPHVLFFDETAKRYEDNRNVDLDLDNPQALQPDPSSVRL